MFILPFSNPKGVNMTTQTTVNIESMTAFPAEMPIGMCYVPFQQWETPYAENVALEKGTIFPSLDLPFMGKEVYKHG
jgi:hypothetical protein